MGDCSVVIKSRDVMQIISDSVVLSVVTASNLILYCKTPIFRVHLIFMNFASSIKSRD